MELYYQLQDHRKNYTLEYFEFRVFQEKKRFHWLFRKYQLSDSIYEVLNNTQMEPCKYLTV